MAQLILCRKEVFGNIWLSANQLAGHATIGKDIRAGNASTAIAQKESSEFANFRKLYHAGDRNVGVPILGTHR
jgi:hypothetical protein